MSHGLIGPREIPRLWDRHVLNCAVVQDAFPAGVKLVDVGSGAGLPGLALAIARPDLDVHLVEPMLRRTQWLSGVVEQLGLENVTVHRGACRGPGGLVAAPFVTARAVARLDKLARWCVPLLEPGGTLVAMKGRSAAEELSADRRALERLGLVAAVVTEHGRDLLDEPVLTVDLRFAPKPARGEPVAPRRLRGPPSLVRQAARAPPRTGPARPARAKRRKTGSGGTVGHAGPAAGPGTGRMIASDVSRETWTA